MAVRDWVLDAKGWDWQAGYLAAMQLGKLARPLSPQGTQDPPWSIWQGSARAQIEDEMKGGR
eukprot:4217381-Karenia_brevis.AAC.1